MDFAALGSSTPQLSTLTSVLVGGFVLFLTLSVLFRLFVVSCFFQIWNCNHSIVYLDSTATKPGFHMITNDHCLPNRAIIWFRPHGGSPLHGLPGFFCLKRSINTITCLNKVSLNLNRKSVHFHDFFTILFVGADFRWVQHWYLF